VGVVGDDLTGVRDQILDVRVLGVDVPATESVRAPGGEHPDQPRGELSRAFRLAHLAVNHECLQWAEQPFRTA
jgi:hypothetical protein